MTEAFMQAVDSLNELANAMEAMDDDEVSIMAYLICDLASHVSDDKRPNGWQAQMSVARLQ